MIGGFGRGGAAGRFNLPCLFSLLSAIVSALRVLCLLLSGNGCLGPCRLLGDAQLRPDSLLSCWQFYSLRHLGRHYDEENACIFVMFAFGFDSDFCVFLSRFPVPFSGCYCSLLLTTGLWTGCGYALMDACGYGLLGHGGLDERESLIADGAGDARWDGTNRERIQILQNRV